MPLRPCIEPSCPNLTSASRCRKHRGQVRDGSTGKWRRLRKKVLRRDHHRCVRCQAPIGLEVDHIDGDRHNDALHNLQVLCVPCHQLKHGVRSGG